MPPLPRPFRLDLINHSFRSYQTSPLVPSIWSCDRDRIRAAGWPARPISSARNSGCVTCTTLCRALSDLGACPPIRGRWDASLSVLITGWDIGTLSPDDPDGWIAMKTRGKPTDPLNTCPVHLFAPSVATWQNALPGQAAGILIPSLPGRAPLRARKQGGVLPAQRAPR